MKNIILGAGEFFVFDEEKANWVSLGYLNKATLNITRELKERIGDNKKLPPKEIIKEIVFTANLYDLKLENIALLSSNSFFDETKKEVVYSNLRNVLKLNRFKFVNVDEFGREFGFELVNGYNKSAIKAEFKEDAQNEEVLFIPIEIVASVSENREFLKIFGY